MKTRSCYVCKTRKPENEFSRDASRSSGLSSKCRLCENKRRLERAKRQREPYQRLIDESKKKGCYLCGEKDPVVLDMHHVKNKAFTICAASTLDRITPLPEFVKELRKCIVLCANCHRRVTRGVIKL